MSVKLAFPLGGRGRIAVVLIAALALLTVFVGAASAGSIGTFDQCSNDQGNGYGAGDTGCRWINGNLNQNNSRYIEGDATVQRLWLTDLTAGQHTVTFHYGSTKNGTHAYDFLTSWSWSENWITLPDLCQNVTGCTAWSVDTLSIPADPYMNSLGVTEPAGQVFTMFNGDLLSATAPAVAHGTYAGDSDTGITITFNVDPSTARNCTTSGGVTTCPVMLVFGAHVARTIDWETMGGGAGQISGSPYHVQLELLDGASVGSRDNQMQSSTVPPNATLIIVKHTVPTSSQDFAFSVTGNGLNHQFLLDDDADPALSNTHTLSLPPGTYVAGETLPAGWNQTSAECSDGSPATAIGLTSGETVTCTFVNTYTLTPSAVSLSSFSGTASAGLSLRFVGLTLAGLLAGVVVWRRRS